MTPDDEADQLASDLHAARLEIARLVRDLGEVTRERDECATYAAALLSAARPLATARGDSEMDRLMREAPERARAIIGVVEAARGFVARLTIDNVAQWHDQMRKKLAALDGKDRP